MPDANGNVKGSGWSRKREAGWSRVFGPKPTTNANRDKPTGGQ